MAPDIIVQVAKVTGAEHGQRSQYDYIIKNPEVAGLTKDSIIRFNKTELAPKRRLGDYIGHLSEEDIQTIKQAGLVESLTEGLNREAMITELEKLGKNYNWSRFDDRQIYSMLQRELYKKPKHTQVIDIPGAEYCPKCGMQLTDSGECPRCDIYDPELI